jgi:rare lipoprotein A
MRLALLILPLLARRLRHPGAAPGSRSQRSAGRRRTAGADFYSAAKKPGPPAKFGGGYKDDGPGDGRRIDRRDSRCRAQARAAAPLRQQSVFGARPRLRAAARAQALQGARHRLLVRARYHGQKTSSGEIYDMYAMTAAHPILPIPSYVRVTNPANGKSVVVRINDRGPFHAGREIDLSWTAAYKLGYVGQGSTLVEVESVLPGQTCLPRKRRPQGMPPAGSAGGMTPPARAARTKTTRSRRWPPPSPSRPAAGAGRARPFPAARRLRQPRQCRSLRARLARELGDLAGKLVVHPAGGLFRVQLGPWPDAAAAQLAGVRLRETLGMAPGGGAALNKGRDRESDVRPAGRARRL